MASSEIAARVNVAAHEVGHFASEAFLGAHHHDADSSDIPGSPTHPVDHDCFQCQVLKHLSRCAVSPLDPPAIAPLCGSPIQPRVRVASQREDYIALLPPVRAPPQLSL